MAKFKLNKIAAVLVALAIPVTLSGCSKESECEIPSRHVHLYNKDTNLGTITTYLDSEYEDVYGGYKWSPEYMEITKEDEAAFKALYVNADFVGLTSTPLFDGEDNWGYLFNLMRNTNRDYFEFYYEYYTTETYTTTDSKGKTEVHTRRVHHDGWHTDPDDYDNTGKARLCHRRYCGYALSNENGKYQPVKSPYVDDIRDVIDDYPYFSEDPTTTVYQYYKFDRRDLKYLNANDYRDVFNHPRLDTNEIHLNDKTMIKR